MNFIALAKNVRALVSAAEDGELTGDLEAALTQADGDFVEKHDAIRAVINELDARADRRFAEAARISELAKRAESASDRLVAWLLAGMRAADVRRIETDEFVTSIVKNGGKPAVKFEGEPEELPERFRKTKTTVDVSINRDAILAAHAAGEELPAGVTVERGERLSLK